jgi:hypothetical protein
MRLPKLCPITCLPITYYLFSLDTGIRLKAFQFLDEQCKRYGDVLPRTILAKAALVATLGVLCPILPRAYRTITVHHRLHQQSFRDRVIRRGLPCKNGTFPLFLASAPPWHPAPDTRHLFSPDGPMLMHGLQECHNACLAVVLIANRLKPNKEFLEERYELFQKAG